MSRKLELAAVVLSTIALGIAYLTLNSPMTLTVVVLAGLGWMYASFRGSSSYASYSFALSVLLNFLAANAGASPILMLFSVSFALAAWDLSRFSSRLEKLHPPEAAKRLEKLHLNRLALALGTGLAIGLLAIVIHIQLHFILAMALGFLAFIGISHVIRNLTAAPSKME